MYIFYVALIVCASISVNGDNGWFLAHSKFTIPKWLKGFDNNFINNKIQNCVTLRGGSDIEHITDLDDFESAIKNPADSEKLFVVDFTATWCGPCQKIAPYFEEMAEEFSDSCVFVKVDVDAGAEIAKEYEVMSMPTFVFIKGGKVVDRFSGASVEKLRQVIFSKIQ